MIAPRRGGLHLHCRSCSGGTFWSLQALSCQCSQLRPDPPAPALAGGLLASAEKGLARICTAIAGFRVQSASRYTTRPCYVTRAKHISRPKLRLCLAPRASSTPCRLCKALLRRRTTSAATCVGVGHVPSAGHKYFSPRQVSERPRADLNRDRWIQSPEC